MVFRGTKRQYASGEVSWQPPALGAGISRWQHGPVSWDDNCMTHRAPNGRAWRETVVSKARGARGNLAAPPRDQVQQPPNRKRHGENACNLDPTFLAPTQMKGQQRTYSKLVKSSRS